MLLYIIIFLAFIFRFSRRYVALYYYIFGLYFQIFPLVCMLFLYYYIFGLYCQIFPSVCCFYIIIFLAFIFRFSRRYVVSILLYFWPLFSDFPVGMLFPYYIAVQPLISRFLPWYVVSVLPYCWTFHFQIFSLVCCFCIAILLDL